MCMQHACSGITPLHLSITRRLAGRKQGRHARFGSSGALAEQPAVARTAVELHGCCARTSLAAALLSQHVDCVTRAGSAGTESGSRARSLVLPWSNLGPAHHVGRPSREAHGLEDQLQLDDEHEAISKIADGGATSGCLPGGPPPSARFCLGFEDRASARSQAWSLVLHKLYRFAFRACPAHPLRALP
jgi:hypothetical protein